MIPPGPVNGVALGGTELVMSVNVGTIAPRCVLRTIDLGQPVHLGNQGEIALCPFESESGIQVDVEGGLLAVLDAQRTAIHLVDLTSDNGPSEIGSWPVGHDCTTIALSGNRLFAGALAAGGAEVDIVDVSVPQSPTLEETVQLAGGACIDLEADGGALAVATFHQTGKAGGVDLHLVDVATATVRSTTYGVSQTAVLRLQIEDSIVFLSRSNPAESELLFVDLQARWPGLRGLPITGPPGATFAVSGGRVAWASGSAGLLLTRVEHCVTPVRDAGDAYRAGYTP
jgi:hypothetical protein